MLANLSSDNGFVKMADIQQSRFEKSLGLLTTRFVSLLQKARDGVLDLKVVRIYFEICYNGLLFYACFNS